MRKVFFFYPKAEKLTGQEQASKLILSSFKDFDFCISFLPAFQRSRRSPFYLLGYFMRVFCSWFNIVTVAFSAQPKVYVNLGQTYLSLIRDGLPFLILSFFKPYSMVISLHGHVFTTWNGSEKVCKLFMSILSRAQVVTVLGSVQKEKLMSLGLSGNKIEIVPNTCEFDVYHKEDSEGSLNILYLSNLIEEKGYLEYLDFLELISQEKLTKKIDAVLCGTIYEGESDQTLELEKRMDKINKSEQVSLIWIKGAYGSDKEELFRKADIFVFPSKYRVEAQPIVLVEAMATSCAIITTKVGEIPSTVSEKCSYLLRQPNPIEIVEKVLSLTEDKLKLKAMQFESAKRFEEFFSLDIYKKNWKGIFNRLDK